MAQNRIWLAIAALAQDLLAWTARLALPASAASYEPKRLRLRILAVAGRIVRTPPPPHPPHRPSLAFLNDTREQLKTRTFTPLPARERLIPKAGQPGKFRRLGIPSARDRLVQAALVLVLEPIFEADFKPCSYGFRPQRRAQDAIAEIGS